MTTGVCIAREKGEPWQLVLSLICAYATTGGKFIGQAPQAELEEVVTLSRQLGDLWAIAHGLNGLGDMYRELGEYVKARSRYGEALRGFRRIKDRWMTAWTLEGLGTVMLLSGNASVAKGYMRESMKTFNSLADRANTIFMLSKLGMLARSEGRHEQAACILAAFKNIQEVLIGHKAANRINYSSELSSAFSEYQTTFPAEWASGQAMSIGQTVEYMLNEQV